MPEDKDWVSSVGSAGTERPANEVARGGERGGRGAIGSDIVAGGARQNGKTCNQCHSVNFANEQLQHGDDMIKNADHLMAQAIREVTGLYKDGVLAKPASHAYAFPNLLTFHDAPTVVEQKLFVMFLEHRMRTFQGTFHASPDCALWYGWSETQRDLTEIRELSAQMRREHARETAGNKN
jgi:hypothetical protein